jgi:hypothetical protein
MISNYPELKAKIAELNDRSEVLEQQITGEVKEIISPVLDPVTFIKKTAAKLLADKDLRTHLLVTVLAGLAKFIVSRRSKPDEPAARDTKEPRLSERLFEFLRTILSKI